MNEQEQAEALEQVNQFVDEIIDAARPQILDEPIGAPVTLDLGQQVEGLERAQEFVDQVADIAKIPLFQKKPEGGKAVTLSQDEQDEQAEQACELVDEVAQNAAEEAQ